MTADEAAQERRRQLEALQRHQREEDVRWVLSTPTGRRFFWRVVDEVCATFGRSYDGTAQGTFFAEGRRSVGLALLTEAQRLASADYVHALQEALAAQEEARLLLEKEGLAGEVLSE